MKTDKSFNSIAEKIDLLFKGRRLLDQCELLGTPNTDKLLTQIKNLQFDIYRLDKYFENNWILSSEEISFCWTNILRSVEKISGKKQSSETLVQDIRAYQKLEEQIRNPKGYSIPDLFSYYHLKTCDVRLARLLIAQKSNQSLIVKDFLRAWDYYDLLSEPCDDLEDLGEDLSTFNGNRFLLGLSLAGLQRTFREYLSFRDQILARINKYEKLLGMSHPASIVLFWAKEQAKTLQDLLQARSLQIQEGTLRMTDSAIVKVYALKYQDQTISPIVSITSEIGSGIFTSG